MRKKKIETRINDFLKEVKGKSKISVELTNQMYSLYNEAYNSDKKYSNCPACDVKVYNGLIKFVK